MSSLAAIACKRGGAVAFRSQSRAGWPSPWSMASEFSSHRCSSSSSFSSSSSQLLAKPKANRVFLVDTLALVKSLEVQGLPTKQAEAVTSAITEVLNDTLERVAQSYSPKEEVHKNQLIQDANLSKSTISLPCKEKPKSFRLPWKRWAVSSGSCSCTVLIFITSNDADPLSCDRYEIDKLAAGQRLDLNLERGQMRDELAKQNAETTLFTTKLDREIHTLRAQLEAAKYDVIKYCMGTLVSISAAGLAVVRILL
ncbi:hypothetical protein ZIOFF_019915 [Zingiber officinale]|uniref:Uncharacterized protein n=1 Tax=Zingiber officinale TaxID=94328 RepID=A0A8J5LPA4_ZINOF|nr:hypothetical protein ZIOFF_019915 [Zingiber officinale]